MFDEPKMTRAERRRREKGVFPCLGCGHRKKLSEMEGGYCRKCANKYRELAKKAGIPPPVHAHIGGLTY